MSNSGTVVRDEQPSKILLIVVTDEVSNSGIDDNLLHPQKVLSILVTDDVSNNATASRFWQLLNNLLKEVTPVMSAAITSMRSLLFSNIANQLEDGQ